MTHEIKTALLISARALGACSPPRTSSETAGAIPATPIVTPLANTNLNNATMGELKAEDPESGIPIRNPVWDKNGGVNIAESSAAIPKFPDEYPEYAPMDKDLDYFEGKFEWRGRQRVFEGAEGWTTLSAGPEGDFPQTMNSCGLGMWMLRWRSENTNVIVEATKGHLTDTKLLNERIATGTYGYMRGFNCEQPAFRFKKAVNWNQSNLVDIVYEFRFWASAP